MSLSAKLAQLIEDFAPIDDAHERLTFAIDGARRHPPLPAIHTDDARVAGCVSAVWLTAEMRGDSIYFQGDADSPLVRGLVIFLTDFFSGTSPLEILGSDLDPLAALGLITNLSPTRRNGLTAVRNRIRQLAVAHAA